MATRILIGCFEVPGWGGASTSAYQLFRRLQQDGLEVSFVNLISEGDAAFLRYTFGEQIGNPLGLASVENCFLEGPDHDRQPGLAAAIERFSPDLLLGVGWIAALLLKSEAPAVPLLYLTTGCEQVKELLSRGQYKDVLAVVRDLETSRGGLDLPARREYDAFRAAALVLTHSEMTRELHDLLFKRWRGKIARDVIWFSEWIADEAAEYSSASRPFEERTIDVLFVASSWSRTEKNYGFVRRLCRQLSGREVHVVGGVEDEIPDVHHHGVVNSRAALFELMGNTRTLVCGSSFDAAPGILFEASVMGCNVVTSRNCGNWRLCHADLLAESYSVPAFVQCIERSLEQKFEDNMEFFRVAGSYKNLKEIIAVL